jgi:hypothetical protein
MHLRGASRVVRSAVVACERLESRRLFNTVSDYQPSPQGPFGYDPVPATLYTPTPRLSSTSSRLFFAEVPVATLEARAANPAYSFIWSKLTSRANTFRTSTPIPATSPSSGVEDPWRSYGRELLNTLVAYYGSPAGSGKTQYLATFKSWINQFSTWWGAPQAQGAAPAASVPRADLAQSLLIEMHAIAYDWIKVDPAFSDVVSNVRNNLTLLTRALRFDQDNGGGAAQWVGDHTVNHNHWNYHALLLAGVSLANDPSPIPGPGEASGWIDLGLANYWFVAQYLNPGGSPVEGYNYDAFEQNTLFVPAYIERTLTQTVADPLNLPAFRNRPIARIQQLIPDGYGAYDWAQGGPSAALRTGWSFHYLASEFNDPLAQAVGNYVVTNQSANEVDWASMFFYNPAVAPTPLANLPLFHNDTQLGISTARSSWNMVGTNAGNNLFMGFHAGPFDGWNSVHRTPPLGTPGGHTLPDQGNIVLYLGNKPILPNQGYPAQIEQTNANTVLFDARDGQPDTVTFSGSPTSGQNGSGGQFFRGLGSFPDQTDHARMLSTSHVNGVHSYLADIGGVYRLNDNREPSGFVRPEYQRRVIFLPGSGTGGGGALAIVDRIRTSQPRDLTFWLPIHNANASLAGTTMNFTTVGDNVAGKVFSYTSIPGATTTITDYTSTAFPISSESLARKVYTIRTTNQTEAVFAVVLGIGNFADNLPLQADANGVTFNGTWYGWDTARRGGRSVATYDSSQGYRLGEELAGQPAQTGTARWTTNGNPNTNERLAVIRQDSDGNRVLATEPWSSAPTRMAFGWLRYSPLAPDLGVESLNQAPVVNVSYRLRLDTPNQAANNTSWNAEFGRVVAGGSQGRTFSLAVQTNGSFRALYGANQATQYNSAPFAPNAWINVSATLNYTSKTFNLSLNGTQVLTGAPFVESTASGFGRFSFSAPGTEANYRQISIDDFSILAVGESANRPTGLSATTSSGVDLAWLDHADNETSNQIQRSTSALFSTFSTINLPANSTSYTDNDPALSPGQPYFYRVRSMLDTIASGFSDSARAIAAAPVLPAPTNLLATAVGTSTVSLSWTLPPGPVTGVELQRSTDGLTFTSLVSLATPATSFNDTTVLDGTTYTYRVAAGIGVVNSPFSLPASATTILAPPAAVTAVAGQAPLTVVVSWTNTSSSLTGTRIERSADAGVTWTTLLTTPGVTHTDSLPVGGTYLYRLTSVGAAPDSTSVLSNTITVIAPLVPTSVSFDGLPSFIRMGATLNLAASVKDQFGNPLVPQPPVTLTRVSGPGLLAGNTYTPLAEGNVTFLASAGGFEATVTLPVVYALRVSNLLVNNGAAQRSMLTSVRLTFNRPVTLGTGALTLNRTPATLGEPPVSIPFTLTTDSTSATLTFPGGIGGSLADGLYELTLTPNLITDAVGQTLAPVVYRFRRLFGDSDGNGRVDVRDQTAFLAALNSSLGQSNYRAHFDFDGDGVISTLDQDQFLLRLLGNAGRRAFV